MRIIITFIQVFSSIITITSAIGLFGFSEKFQSWSIQVNQLQIFLGVSLVITILSFVFGNRLKRGQRDTKIQFQLGGRNNKQNMR